MPLKYPPEWKFGPDGVTVPPSLLGAVQELVSEIAGGASSGRWDEHWVVETFKSRFGSTSGSSNASWAYSDLGSLLSRWTSSGAKFAEAVWMAIEDVAGKDIATPGAAQVNALFKKHGFPYRIEPPNLRREGVDAVVADDATDRGQPSEERMIYEIGEQIGEGGFGTVHRVSRSTSITTFDYALKFLDPSSFVKNPEHARERFKREVQAVQKLNHRGIVHYIDAGIDQQGRPYLVMPLIQGQDVRKAAEQQPHSRRPLLMAHVLDAVAHAHGLEVLHRDLKPSNIIVRDSDKHPIIVDWGLSYLFDDLDRHSLTTSAVGSMGYIPSEVQANPKQRTKLQDVYACGVLTYEIMAGCRPDPNDYMPLAEVDSSLQMFDPIVKKALAPASARYSSAAEFRDELERTTRWLLA